MSLGAQPSLTQHLWDALSVGVCLVNEEGTIIQMNVAASRLLGWGAVCPTDLSIYDVIERWESDEGDQSSPQSILSMIKDKKIGWFPRIRARCRQETWCWVEMKGVVIEEEECSQFLFMFRDLSSETRLAEEYSRLASIPEESPFPIIEVDEEGHLLYANPSMVSLMEEAQIGHDGFTTALPQQFPELAARCFSQGHLESNIEVQVGEKHYAWSFSSHPELGRLRGYGMDITDSKRASEELATFAETLETKNQELDQALVKAEAATRAKAAFLATMSHEIRTPLNGVIGMAELLLNSTLDMEHQECLKIIRKSGEGLLQIINDILDFSKIESGHMVLETIGFNPLVLIEEVVDLFSERAYHKKLDIAAYVDPDIPGYLLGDPHRLRQILCNFISNALKFTTHGSVLIEATWLSDGMGKDSNQSPSSKDILTGIMGTVRFAVKDTGIGMPQGIPEKIFQVFTQADSSMSRKFGGSGLGLAICKQLAELMNGTVGVESQVGMGSTFWCDLPFRFQQLVSEELPKGFVETKGTQDKEILVCAAVGATTDVLSRYLHVKGINVRRAEQAQDAMGGIENSAVDLSKIFGIIMGRDAISEDWSSWVTAIQQNSQQAIKVWQLTPFWMRKGHDDSIRVCDGIITLPLHRDQLYGCVFGQTGGLEVERLQKEMETYETTDQNYEISPSHFPAIEGNKKKEQHGLRPSVLIVEDNPINQKVAAGLFEKLGCQVYVAESGEQALSFVQDYHIDVVMMDWELPGMDGFEVAQAIRELEQANGLKPTSPYVQHSKHVNITGDNTAPCSHLPIVGMTAHGHSNRHPSRWAYVMDDCLAKPIHLQDLASVLDRWVRIDRPPQGQHASQSHNLAPDNLPSGNSSGSFEKVISMSDSQNLSEKYQYSLTLESMEDNEELLHSLFGIFLETWPVLAMSMREAIAQQDRVSLQGYAHQAKGALFALHAGQQALQAAQLEVEAVKAPFSEIASMFEAMENEMNALIDLFRKILFEKKKGV